MFKVGCPLPQPYTRAELRTSVVQRAGDGGSVVQQQLQISATDNVRRVQRFVSWVVRPAGSRAGGKQDRPMIIEGWALGECPLRTQLRNQCCYPRHGLV
jgi:hypothetical protein